MADQKTAAEWRGVSDALTQQKAAVEKQLTETSKESLRLINQRDNLLVEQSNASFGRQVEISRQLGTLDKQISNNTIYSKQLTGQVAEINQSIDVAGVQYETALDAPSGTRANPVTHANPPPVTDIERENASLLSRYPPPADTGDETLRLLNRYPPPGTGGDTTASPEPPIDTGVAAAQDSGALPAYVPFPDAPDYRVRISLAPSSNYLYNDPAISLSDLLYPLRATNGVIFPYVPQITVTHNANYSPTELTHSNYKSYNYVSSSVEGLSIVGDFTAQDVGEANYVLAVIHFFRSVTKMFYGQDQNKGVPPPLVYLSGHGEYGFNNHAMVITTFTLNWPSDVDYINAGPMYNQNVSFNNYKPPALSGNSRVSRLRAAKLQPGGVYPAPQFSLADPGLAGITRIPTKINIQLSAIPIVTRYDISNNFSLQQYATGQLLKGNQNTNGRGMW